MKYTRIGKTYDIHYDDPPEGLIEKAGAEIMVERLCRKGYSSQNIYELALKAQKRLDQQNVEQAAK